MSTYDILIVYAFGVYCVQRARAGVVYARYAKVTSFKSSAFFIVLSFPLCLSDIYCRHHRRVA